MQIADDITAIGEKLKSEASPAEDKKEIPVETKVETPVATETKDETPVAENGTEKKEIPVAEANKEEFQKELSDDELLQLIQKRGIKLPEERTKTEDEELFEAIDYGIKNGKFKKEDYDEAVKIKDIAAKDLVFSNFASSLKAKNKNISDEDIQKKFDRKFGDEILDETDNPKIVYDEDEIADVAQKIRDQKFAPINNVKNEFSEVTKRNKFNQQVEQEFKKNIESKITDKVVVKHGNADYTIELDKDYLNVVKQKVYNGFMQFKQHPDQFGNQFETEKLVEFIVKSDKFDDIATVISKQRSDADVLEALKPFKNPVETDKQRDTTPQGGKPITEAANQLGEQLRRFAG